MEKSKDPYYENKKRWRENNREKDRQSHIKWSKNNREKEKEIKRNWDRNNKEKKKIWWNKNYEKIKAYKKIYNANNIDKVRKYKQKWSKLNPEKIKVSCNAHRYLQLKSKCEWCGSNKFYKGIIRIIYNQIRLLHYVPLAIIKLNNIKRRLNKYA